MVACPFQVPAYEYDNPLTPQVRKCTFCFSYVKEGGLPACAQVCPREVITFGKKNELLKLAQWKMKNNPGKYVDHIYGEHEAGGTSWLYISPVPFEKLAFPMGTGTTPYPEYTEAALDSVPPTIVIGGTVLAGLYLLWKRRISLASDQDETGADTHSGEAGGK